MVILGLDAGFVLPGYGIVDTVSNTVLCAGSIATSRLSKKDRKKSAHFYVSHDDARRVAYIYAELKKIVQQYHPETVCIELPVGAGRSSSAVKGMAYASAIAAILAQECKLNPVFLTPAQNKMASTGMQDGEKDQVMAGVQRRFTDVNWPVNRQGQYNKLQCWAMADALSTIMWWESL